MVYIIELKKNSESVPLMKYEVSSSEAVSSTDSVSQDIPKHSTIQLTTKKGERNLKSLSSVAEQKDPARMIWDKLGASYITAYVVQFAFFILLFSIFVSDVPLRITPAELILVRGDKYFFFLPIIAYVLSFMAFILSLSRKASNASEELNRNIWYLKLGQTLFQLFIISIILLSSYSTSLTYTILGTVIIQHAMSYFVSRDSMDRSFVADVAWKIIFVVTVYFMLEEIPMRYISLGVPFGFIYAGYHRAKKTVLQNDIDERYDITDAFLVSFLVALCLLVVKGGEIADALYNRPSIFKLICDAIGLVDSSTTANVQSS